MFHCHAVYMFTNDCQNRQLVTGVLQGDPSSALLSILSLAELYFFSVMFEVRTGFFL